MSAPQIIGQHHISYAEYEYHHKVILAHGVVLGFAFAFMYPFGAAAIRGLSFKGLLWFHAWWQIAAYMLTLVGLGTGIWLVVTQHEVCSSPTTSRHY